MSSKYGFANWLLIIALLLGVLSVFLTKDGLAQKALPPDDPRVRASIEYLLQRNLAPRVLAGGKLEDAWLSRASGGYKVNLGFLAPDGRRWLFGVVFDANDDPVDANVGLWTSRLLPTVLALTAILTVSTWLVITLVLPQVFGVKCPDCRGILGLRVVTKHQDKLVYAGGFDKNGDSLPPILERTYICPRCGYQKITYAIAEGHREGNVKWVAGHSVLHRASSVAPLYNPKEMDWYEKMQAKWEQSPERIQQFETYDEWKEYFQRLKDSEREVRPK